MPVGGPCNESCLDCAGRDTPAVDPEDVRAAAEARRPAVLVLTGPGEPTMRNDLEALVHAARRGGAGNVALVTNGRALAYPRVTAIVASLRLSHVIVTVRHLDPLEHDRTTRTPGSHGQVMTGLSNLSNLVRGTDTRIVLRVPTRTDGNGSLAGLSFLASRFGASAVWLDGAHEPDAGRMPDERFVLGQGIDALLAQVPFEERSRSGSVPARLHEDEASVSMVIRTGCRNACSFCTTRIIQEQSRASWVLDDLSIFHPQLDDAISKGLNILRFVAIEPLEHPDICDLIRFARDIGFVSIAAWTSARALADERWADGLRDAGLTDIEVPLMGSRARVHDKVAGAPGSFEQTMAGVNAGLSRFRVRYHLIVVKQNLDDVPSMLDMAERMGLGEPGSILIPAPSSSRPEIFAGFAARLADIARLVGSLEPNLRRRLISSSDVGLQVPPCVLEDSPGIGPDDLLALPAPCSDWVTEGKTTEPGASFKLRSPCPHAPGCAAAPRCPGVYGQYIEVFGASEFVPRVGQGPGKIAPHGRKS